MLKRHHIFAMEKTEESLDFDFFETPRCLEDDTGSLPAKKVSDISHSELESKIEDIKQKEKDRRSRSSSPVGPKRSVNTDYSSDSDSVSEDEWSGKIDNRRRRSDSSLSSLSSVSGSRSSSRTRSYSSESDSNSSSPWDGGKDRNTSDCERGSNFSRNRKVLPKRGVSRQGEDEYSSSAYSDGDDVGSYSSFSESKDKIGQAWGEKTSSDGGSYNKQNSRKKMTQSRKSKCMERPKTAKNSSNANRDKQLSQKRSDSEVLSDSDITDVSPIDSPRPLERSVSDIDASGDKVTMKHRYKTLPIDKLDLRQHNDDNDDDLERNGLDLEILMKAVGELEKQKRVEANTRRVMFAPMNLKRSERSNYTFDKDKTRSIDKENERLLKEIVRRVNSGENRKKIRVRSAQPTKATPSAINREREMKRIESENLAFLNRLQKVKATKTISRDNQLRAYAGTKLHGIPIAALHPVPRSGVRSPFDGHSAQPIGVRTRSMTSLHSTTSSVLSTPSRRSSRPSSATKHTSSRPQWSDRW